MASSVAVHITYLFTSWVNLVQPSGSNCGDNRNWVRYRVTVIRALASRAPTLSLQQLPSLQTTNRTSLRRSGFSLRLFSFAQGPMQPSSIETQSKFCLMASTHLTPTMKAAKMSTRLMFPPPCAATPGQYGCTILCNDFHIAICLMYLLY
jgi:hypothetical protein